MKKSISFILIVCLILSLQKHQATVFPQLIWDISPTHISTNGRIRVPYAVTAMYDRLPAPHAFL